MRKSQALRSILKVAKGWEGSKPNIAMAREILAALIEEGMLPPFSNERDLGCECGCKGRCPLGHEWDYERFM